MLFWLVLVIGSNPVPLPLSSLERWRSAKRQRKRRPSYRGKSLQLSPSSALCVSAPVRPPPLTMQIPSGGAGFQFRRAEVRTPALTN